MRISRVITRTPEDEVQGATATVETTTAEEGMEAKTDTENNEKEEDSRA